MSAASRCRAGLALLALASGVLASAAVSRAEPVAAEPSAVAGVAAEAGIAQADAHLADRDQWPRAIELYQAVLRGAPARHDARQRLARVLAWSGRYDESLAQYDRLLADVPSPEARVERAEVLSWAGRYAEAAAAFEALLADDPGDARAARGLARVYLWSGDVLGADAAFERALALEDVDDARNEWNALRESVRPTAEVRTVFFDDDAGFQLSRSGLHVSLPLDLRWRFFGQLGVLEADQHDYARTASARGRRVRDSDRAVDASLGLERRFDAQWLASLELGVRAWRHASDRPYGRLQVQFTPTAATAATLDLAHGDHLDSAHSRGSVDHEVHGTTLRLGIWQAFSDTVEGYAQARAGLLSDSNWLQDGYAELGVRPFGLEHTRLAWQGSIVSYAHRTAAYYSPNLSASTGLALRQQVPLGDRWSLLLEARGGYGFTREARLRSTGPEWGGGGALEWLLKPWRVRLEGKFDQSQRSTTYQAVRVGVLLGREF